MSGSSGRMPGSRRVPASSGSVGLGPVMIAAAALFGCSSLLIASAPRSIPVPFLAIGWFVGSFVGVVFNVNGASLGQAVVPVSIRGRVVGFNRFCAFGLIPLGS